MANGLNGDIFELLSLKGGLDDTSPYTDMEADVCVTAENVEFVKSTLGERRLGCEAIADTPAPLTNVPAGMDTVAWLYRHLTTNDPGDAQLWMLAQSLSINTYSINRRSQIAWNTIAPPPTITLDVSTGNGYRLSAQTLHGKLFIAANWGADRIAVYDGPDTGVGTMRLVGLTQPTLVTPTVDTAPAGTYANTRYFRTRVINLSGTTLVTRSEPSTTETFIPLGTRTGAIITRPAWFENTGATHWEVEGSADNVNFYRLAQVAIGTSTYTDTATAASYSSNILSAAIGTYSLLPSCKHLSVDQDRLIMAGSWYTASEASRVRWTPVYNDPIGGNDERIALDTSPYIDLDGVEGGEITAMSRNINGYIYIFKRSHIYKMMRTGQLIGAYEAVPMTKDRGALPRSLIEATDQSGAPALYFLDPTVGPMRLGSEGLQWCGRDIQTLWGRVNVNATLPCHGVYYSAKRQVHYWLAVDGADTPNIKIVLHVNEVRNTDEGARRGWVTVSKNSRIATADCSVMFSSNVDTVSTDRNYNLIPIIGKQKWVVSGSTIPYCIQKCDMGGTDAYTTGDTAASYRGTVTTRPFVLRNLLSQFEVKSGGLLLRSEDTPDGLVFLKLVKNFGAQEKLANAAFYSVGEESHIIAQLDDFEMAELYALQISLGDLDDSVTPPDYWELDMLDLKISGGNAA